MMKILNIISQYPGKTGSGTYLNSLIKEGKKLGYRQALVAALPKGDYYRDDNLEEFYPLYFNSQDLPFPIVGMSDVMPYDSLKYSELDEEKFSKWQTEFKNKVSEAINKFEPDIIISHHLWLLTSIVVDLAKDIKTIGICHGTDIRQLENNPHYKDLVVNNIKKLDHIVSLNNLQMEEIIEYYQVDQDKISVVGGGFNAEVFYRTNEKKDSKTIGLIYVGKLSYQKGLLSLIKIFTRIKGKYDLDLTIVGSGTGEEAEHIINLGRDKNIKFLGQVSQDELGTLYRNSDIFLLPSFYEGLSLVTIEALACGLLAVVSEIPGLIDYLGQAINESGIIEYIDLPQMRYNELPQGEDLDRFESDFKLKLERQINRYISGFTIDDSIEKEIDSKSWSSIYKKIESCFFKD